MNLGQLRQRVRDLMGLTAGDPLQTDSVLNGFINDALHMIETEHDWPWLEASETINTVAATSAYTPAAGWMRTIDLRIAGQPSLDKVPLQKIGNYGNATGRPLAYALRVDQLVFAPTPDTVYGITHTYIKPEPDLALDTATPLMPASYHAGIANLAAFLAYGRQRDSALAQIRLQDYQAWLAQMLKRGSRESDSGGGGTVPEPPPPLPPARP